MSTLSEIVNLVILAGVGSAIYISYKAGILDQIYHTLFPPGPIGGGGTTGGNQAADGVTQIYQSSANNITQRSPDGAGGQVSLHGMASGGSSWRKQWTFTGPTYTNVEVSGYFYIPGGNDTISCKVRGNGHSDSKPKAGCCYDFQLPFPNGTSNTNFSKECPHPQYDKIRLKTEFDIGSTLKRWIGQKAITINSGNSVICEQWLDVGGIVNNKPANQWKRWYRVVDSGNVPGMNGARKLPFLTPAGNSVIWRIDGTSKAQVSAYQAKFLSARAIIGTRASGASSAYTTPEFRQELLRPWSPVAAGQMLLVNQMRSRLRRY